MKALMSIKDENSIAETLENYWSTFWNDNERERFSPMSMNAFKTLKTICKYHLFEKRDGSIVNKIQDVYGNLISNQDKVSELSLRA